MNYDVITLMKASEGASRLAHSALPDAPVMSDFMPAGKESVSAWLRRGVGNTLFAFAAWITPETDVSPAKLSRRSASTPVHAC